MSASVVRAGRVASRLSAAGISSRTTEYVDRTQVEAEMTGELSEESWREVLAALEEADEFGLLTSAKGRSVWAVFSK